MNAPIKIAQANTQQSAAPEKIIKLTKPADGQAITVETGYEGKVKLDFSAIADERITIVRIGERAVIFFHDNKSTITLDPFFGSGNLPLANLEFDLGGNRIFTAEQIAGILPFTVYQGILPAAGDGAPGAPQEAGANFNPANVEDLPPIVLNLLLPPEELPPIEFLADTGALLVTPLVITGTFFGLVEEEQFFNGQEGENNPQNPTDAGIGNEDVNDLNGFDTDEFPPDFLDNVTLHISGSLAPLVSGGTPPYSFKFIDPSTDGDAENDFVHDTDSNAVGDRIFSQGDDVHFEFQSSSVMWGVASDGRLVFIVTLDNSTGQLDFFLNDQIDHPLASLDDGTNLQGIFEEMLALNLSSVIEISDAGGQSVNLGDVPGGPVVSIGVIDDTPILGKDKEIRTVNEDDIQTGDGTPDGSTGTSPQDGDFDGSFTGNPGDGVLGPATIFGSLAGTVLVGADKHPDTDYAKFSFVGGDDTDLSYLFGLGLTSKGGHISYDVAGNVLYGFVDNDPGPGHQFYDAGEDRLVFKLILEEDGDYTFELHDQLDHDAPYDDFPTFPVLPGDTLNPPADQNHDLQETIDGDVVFINFGSLIKAVDFDGDAIILDNKLQIAVTDDIPELKSGSICLTVDEDDIETVGYTDPENVHPGSLGTSPQDSNGDGSYTGNPANNNPGPAYVSGTLAGIVVESGADEELTFSFISEGALRDYLEDLDLTSQGGELSYDLVGNILYAFVNQGQQGEVYHSTQDRLVFTFEITNTTTGAFEFKLYDQLDHDAPDGNDLSDENFDLEGQGNSPDVWSIDFGRLLKATDYDGDSVVLKDKLDIKIRDDVPELKSGSICLTVDEDDISTIGYTNPANVHPGSLGTSPNDGNADGSYTGNPADGNPGPAFVSGTLGGVVVESGADEKLTFSFISEGALRDYLEDLDLTSQGGELSYDLQGNILYAFVNANQPGVEYNSGADRLVFTFEITNTTTGAFEFKLYDQLDHDAPDGNDLSDENQDLEGQGNSPDVWSIDFGSILKATDYDGDSVILEDKLEIKITDDVPQLKGKECLTPGTSYQGADPSDLLFVLPAGGATVHIDISNITSDAEYENSIGYYFADAAGNPISGHILADNAKSDDNEQLVIQSGDVPPGAVFVGFFIIPDGNNENSISDGDDVTFVFEGGKWVAYHDGNALDSAHDYILFSDRRLNPDISPDGNGDPQDDFEQSGNGGFDSNWEDKVNDSDKDFNDVRFDVKVCATPEVFLTVDEDDIQTVNVTPPPGVNPGSTGTSPQDGNGDGSYTGNPGDGTPGPAFVSGTLAGVVVESGADENLTFSFISEGDLRDYLEDLDLTSQGGELSYDLVGNILYAFVNADQPGEVYHSTQDRLVFTFEITNTTTGAFEFKLYDQLDHDAPDGNDLSDENTDLEGQGNSPDVWTIDFGSILQAEDYDHDRVILEDKVIIQIRDDVPQVNSGVASISVDEDDLNNYDPSDANNDGIYGSQGSSPGGLTTVNGAIGAGVVTAGADEPLTFSFVDADDVRDYLEDLGLRSKGALLSYDLQTPGVIKAFDNDGPNIGQTFDTGAANDRLVFTFTLNPNGTFTFTLHDQLDHDVPNDDAPTDNVGTGPGADENIDLRDSLAGDLTYIDFGAIIEATDFDGDSVLLTNKVRVEIVDDIPTQKSSATTSVQVEEDELNSNTEGSDLSIGISDFDAFDDDANISAASILGLFNTGADEPLTVALNSSIGGNVQTTGGVNVTSKGDQVRYAFSGGVVIGYADSNNSNTFNGGERIVFRISASGGNFTFDLEDQLDHSPGISATDTETMTLNISSAFRVTDFDGDSVVPTGSLLQGVHVVVENDIPAIVINTQQPQLSVTHDETGGLQNGGANTPNVEDNNDGDTAGSTAIVFNGGNTTIAGLFNGLAGNFLDDPHVSNDPASTNSAIGFARSAGAIFGVTVTPGADEPVSPVSYSFGTVNSGLSGLSTTEGKAIHLFKVNDTTVVGYYDDDGDDIVQLDGNDPIALALRIDPITGVLYVAQWVSLDHPVEADFTGDESYDEAVTFASGTISIQASATDFDGDIVSTPAVDLWNKVFFEDDGPKVNDVTQNVGYGDELISNGSFEQGHGLVGNNWEIFNSITDWEDGADGIPFEVQTGGAGGVAAQHGNALIELDSDTEGNPDNALPDVNPTNFTNATISQTIAGTEAGQQYELSFWYRPRPSPEGTNSGGMKVFFEGNEVLDIPSNPNPYSPNAWTKITLLVNATGPNAELAFQGQGSENEHGAFLDNVSLRAVYGHTLDDEDTTLNPATELQGGPGDDGAGVTASGTINFAAGADGLKSIEVHGIDGLTAIYVDEFNVGHVQAVSYNWVADGFGGGTLTGSTANLPQVFTLEVDSDGNYTFTLIAPLNHPEQDDGDDANGVETSWEDNLELNFGFTVSDGDNDKATGTLSFNVDDDSPEYVYNSGTGVTGIEDGEVVTLNVAITEDLNIAFGADGMHAGTEGLRITEWPALPGVFNELSPDGLQLKAFIGADNTGTPLYTLTLNPSTGQYTFTQHAAFPGSVSELPEVATNDAFGPTPTRDYAGFTVNSASLLNGSAQGIGVGNNGIEDGEQLNIVFDNPMLSATLGINHIGNGTMEIDWVAYSDAAGTIMVASGSTLQFNSDGTVVIDPAGALSFLRLDLTGDFISGPNANAVQFRITTVGGESESSNTIDELSFSVTGKDGDDDAVTDVFTVGIIDTIPFGQERGANGLVEEEELDNLGAVPGVANVQGSKGNEDDYEKAGLPPEHQDQDDEAGNDFDNTNDVYTGTLAVTGGNGGNEFSFIAGIHGTPVLFKETGTQIFSKASGGGAVYFFLESPTVLLGVAEHHGNPLTMDGHDRIVFRIDLDQTSGEFTFTLIDQIDHHPHDVPAGGVIEFPIDHDEGVMTIDLANVFRVTDDANQTHDFQDVSVAVIDDIPVTERMDLDVDEDDLTSPPASNQGNSNEDAGDDLNDPSPTVISGTLSASQGADEGGQLTLTNSGAVKDTNGNDVYSGGEQLFWFVEGFTIFATTDTSDAAAAEANAAFKFQYSHLGNFYTFTLLNQLDHPDTDGPNNDLPGYEDNLLIDIGYTLTDRDGDAVSGTVRVNVDDDMPVVVSCELDGPNDALIADGFVYNSENGHHYKFVAGDFTWTEAADAAEALGGYLATITSAQENAFAALLQGGTGGAWLGGQDVDLNGSWFWVTGPEAGTMFWNNGTVGAYTNWNAGTGEPSQDPIWIEDSLHFFPAGYPTDSWNDLNDLDSTNFTRGYLVEIGGDDCAVCADIEEPTGQNGPATVQTTLLPLVAFGADGMHASGGFGLLAFAAQDFGTLEAGGEQVQIVSNGTTLTGFTTGTNPLFTLEIVSNEAVFTLYGDLDHGDLDQLTLEFGQFIKATDGDGDYVTLDGKVEICVEDIPNIPFGEERGSFGVVEEEHLSYFNPDYATTGTANFEGSIGNEDDYEAPGVPANSDDDDTVAPNDFDNTTDVTTGTLAITGGNGGNEFSIVATDGQFVHFAEGPSVFSKGQKVAFIRDTVDPNVLYGVANGGGVVSMIDDATDRIVFRILLNPTTGEFTFTLLDQLDHHPYDVPAGDPVEFPVDNDEGVMTINLANVFQVEDDAAQTHVFQDVAVAVIDDIPVITPFTTGNVTVLFDESSAGAGPVPNGDNFDDDDTLQQRPNGTDAIGQKVIAGSTISSLFGTSVGADEPGATPVYSLVLKDGSGAVGIGGSINSNRQVTQPKSLGNPDSDNGVDGNPFTPYGDATIHLVQVSATVIEGHVGGVGGDVALRLTIDTATGAITVQQILAIDHGVDGNDHDRGANPPTITSSALFGGIFIGLSLTDADGDTVGATSTTGIDLAFEDTGIVVNGISSDTEVGNESHAGEGGVTVNGTWDIVVGNDGLAEVRVQIAGEDDQVLSMVDDNQSVVFDLDAGELTVNSDFTWTFEPSDSISANTQVSFKIRIEDGDTDFDDETHIINVANQLSPPVIGQIAETDVDEDGFLGAPYFANVDGSGANDANETNNSENLTDTGSISVAFGDNQPGNLAAAFAFQATDLNGQLETTDGTDVLFTVESGELVGRRNDDNEEVIRIEITTIDDNGSGNVDYNYQVTLSQPVKHAVNPGEDSKLLADVLFTVTNTDGTDIDSFDVTIWDDVPVAKSDTAEVEEGTSPTLNAVIVLDLSGSMQWALDSNTSVPYADSRLKLMQDAVQSLLSSPDANFNEIIVYTFAGDGVYRGTFNTTAGAIAEVNSYDFGDLVNATDFDEGAEDIIATFPDFTTPASQTNLYWLTDVDTSVGFTQLDGTTADDWEDFLADEGIDKVVAVGFSGNADPSDLALVAPRTEDEAIIIDDPNDLSVTLGGTLPGSVSGNVLLGTNGIDEAVSPATDDDGFGADGGRILSIEVDTIVYTYDPDADEITNDDNATVINGPVLTIGTDLGGELTFHFADNGSNAAGDWDYTAPDDVPADDEESFKYTLIDGDGDSTYAFLTIDVLDIPNAPPVANADELDVTEAAHTNNGSGGGTGPTAGIPSDTIDVLGNDTDPGDTMRVSQITLDGGSTTAVPNGGQVIVQGVYGTLTIHSNGTATYNLMNTLAATQALQAGQAEEDVFTYEVTDSIGQTDTAEITVNVTGANDAPVIWAPADFDFVPGGSFNDNFHLNTIQFADVDSDGDVTVTLTNDAGDGDNGTFIASNGGGVVVTGSNTNNMTLTGTIAELNAFIAGNSLRYDMNGTDGETVFVSINDGDGGTDTHTINVNDNSVSSSGEDLPDNDTFNVYSTSIDLEGGSDSLVTGWNHLGSGATVYQGGESGSTTDTIRVVFTPDQLNEILNVVGQQNALRTFLTTPNSNNLDLDASSWNAEVEEFETANLGLAAPRDTNGGDNYVDLDTWAPIPAAVAVGGGTGAANLIVGTAAGQTLSGLGGNDVLAAFHTGANTLLGGDNNDLLLGGDGDDLLDGGGGNDYLAGGKGADTFVASATGTANIDTIIDYNFAEGDALDLSALLDGVFDVGDDINEYVQVTTVNTNDLLVRVETDGSGLFDVSDDTFLLAGAATNSADPIRILIDAAQQHVVTG